jgi:hypothetical protein
MHLITVIFDGSTQVSEVISIIFRYVTNKLVITERLVELGCYKHGFNQQELVSAVLIVLSKYDLYVGTSERGRNQMNGQVISFQRDRYLFCCIYFFTHKRPPCTFFYSVIHGK